jgi:hypothetical protein
MNLDSESDTPNPLKRQKQEDQQSQGDSSDGRSGADEEGEVEKEEQDAEEFQDFRAFKEQDKESKEWKNRQRVLIVSQRGMGGKFRTLMEDIAQLIPHSKSEGKVERKKVKEQVDGICFERSCNNFLYFE